MRLTCKADGCEQSPVGRFCVDHIRERMCLDDEKAARIRAKQAAGQARAHRLKKHYDMTPDEYSELLTIEHGGCAICGKTSAEEGRSLSVDHDHKTGAVRGILCGECNTGLGRFDDEPQRLMSAAQYLLDTPAHRLALIG